jgi:hypothetical protein
LGEEFEDAWFCGRLDVLDRGLAKYQPPGFWGTGIPGRVENPWTMVMETRKKLLAAIAHRQEHVGDPAPLEIN